MNDHLESPPIDEPAAVVPFPLKRLSDELFLHVVAQIPEVDLHKLCLAAKHIGSMTQEALHRYPTTSYSADAMPRRMARLARTLFSRADLARAVSILSKFRSPHCPRLIILLDDDRRNTDLSKLFQRMPFLRSLFIIMINKCLFPGRNQIEADILGDDARGSMEVLIEIMATVSQTLVVLCIKEAGADLGCFNQMKYLQIPIEGVSEQNLVSRKRIEEMLPDRLECLRLSGLSVEAMKGLEDVSSEDASLAFLALLG